MEYLNLQTLLLPMATAVGAYGGFPEAPKLFKSLSQNMMFQWLMVFVLIYQGGSGQNVELALVATVVLFALSKVADMVYSSNEGYRQF